MRALLFGMVLLFSIPDTAAGQDRCDSLRTAATSIRPSLESTDRAAWTRYLKQTRSARACYKNPTPHILYYDETTALFALGRLPGPDLPGRQCLVSHRVVPIEVDRPLRLGDGFVVAPLVGAQLRGHLAMATNLGSTS